MGLFGKREVAYQWDCLYMVGSSDIFEAQFYPFYGIVRTSEEGLQAFCEEVLEEAGFQRPYRMISKHLVKTEKI